jgi:molybdenum cofactor guanylyltransferase
MSALPADDAPAAATAAPLYGLVLAGGRSSRMGRDKAALVYGDDSKPQIERAMALLASHVVRAYVSVRADQRADPLRARFPQIIDRLENTGPIAGILAAQELHPQGAWLVLACDLPLLSEATLAQLLRERASTRLATAFRSSHDGLPEPLCAIYEPASRGPLAAWITAGNNCPRKFLSAADALLVDNVQPHTLDNVNTPDDYGSAKQRVQHTATEAVAKRVTVQYYALLREQAGRREEALSTHARTPAELYAELARRYPFTLGTDALRVAINSEFRDWSTPLGSGDAVVFIPPVAGG